MNTETNDPPVEPARSALMARIGPKNSKPEIVVRQLLHTMGYRFRLHAKELPGRELAVNVGKAGCGCRNRVRH